MQPAEPRTDPRPIAIVGGNLVDGTGGPTRSEIALVTNGDRVERVGPAASTPIPPGAEIVEASGMTIMPGLINCHTHLCLDGSPDPIAAWQGRSLPENVLIAARQAGAALRAGVTTVRDLGGWDGVDLGLRKAIDAGVVPGPRMLVSGKVLCMTGGHGNFMGREVDGADEARKGAREQLKAGADIIKVMATGGVMTAGVDPGSAQLTYEELRAAVQEAEKAGKGTATHAQGTAGIKDALRAGIDSIEHGFFLDAEALDMMLERGTHFVPTLASIHHLLQSGPDVGIPDFMIEKARRASDAHLDSFRRAREAGVRIAAGNDGGTPFNPTDNLVSELECMVAAGMSPREALSTAHAAAAQLLRLDDQIGTVEPGKRADLVVLDGDPLDDIAAVRRVHLVVKAGQRV